jgi:glycosyltransferase involved in cell wall biosynthesis
MYYGRPGISKGVEYLVQSVSFVARKIPNSKLLLILANDPVNRYEIIKKMIEDLNIRDKIILLDPVPRAELPDYIAASDCVVIPSLSEGFGFAAAEACAMGKPLVASDVGSLPEVVSGRYVLVEPRNPEAIADAIEKIYKGEVKDTGKRIFSWDECIERYFKIYQDEVR